MLSVNPGLLPCSILVAVFVASAHAIASSSARANVPIVSP